VAYIFVASLYSFSGYITFLIQHVIAFCLWQRLWVDFPVTAFKAEATDVRWLAVNNDIRGKWSVSIVLRRMSCRWIAQKTRNEQKDAM